MPDEPKPTSGTCEKCGATMQNQGPTSKCTRCLNEQVSEKPRPTPKPR